MKRPACVVVDYGSGNVFSVMHALEACGAEAVLSGDSQIIRSAERVILPGVGAFRRAADRLRALGLDNDIREFTETGRPFLGICVGMQLLLETGTEFGESQGLGLIGGSVRKVSLKDLHGEDRKVPLIGWYPVAQKSDSFAGTVFDANSQEDAYYFVHSYSAQPTDPSDVLATVDHEGQHIVAALRRDNITGVQFHPERSSESGLRLLRRFLDQ